MEIYLGTQMSEQILIDYKSSIGEEINFIGFNHGTSKEQAIADAITNEAAGKVPVLIQIDINSDFNLFKVDQVDYSPYALLEQSVILQDGIMFKVLQVEPVKVEFDGQEHIIARISLLNDSRAEIEKAEMSIDHNHHHH